MNNLRVALLQISPLESEKDNLLKGIEMCKKAKDGGADIALFPEMWSCGYDFPTEIHELKKRATPINSDFVLAFEKLSKELDIAIGITLLESFEPSPRNSLILFDRHGKKVLRYSKVHTCDFGYELNLSRGEDFFVTDLDTAKGNVKVGAMICYDREFPESARILMLKGAEIILVPNACPMEINRLAQLRARSYENMLGIATCNYPDSQPDCNGHSSAFDGVAYLPNILGSRDMCVLEADGKEGVYFADFDLKLLRDYRNREVHGNAYRRPSKYRKIIEEEISEPFIREDRREDK